MASNADNVCSGLSGRWFHTWKTQAISPKNTLRPMLIPERTKSTWQPIKSEAAALLSREAVCDVPVSVCTDPMLQMKQSRSVWELSALSPTPSPESTREQRPHRDTCIDFFYSLIWTAGADFDDQSAYHAFSLVIVLHWMVEWFYCLCGGGINSANFPTDKVESS